MHKLFNDKYAHIVISNVLHLNKDFFLSFIGVSMYDCIEKILVQEFQLSSHTAWNTHFFASRGILRFAWRLLLNQAL